MWEVAEASPITREDVEIAQKAYEAKLDSSFFKVRLDRATLPVSVQISEHLAVNEITRPAVDVYRSPGAPAAQGVARGPSRRFPRTAVDFSRPRLGAISGAPAPGASVAGPRALSAPKSGQLRLLDAVMATAMHDVVHIPGTTLT